MDKVISRKNAEIIINTYLDDSAHSRFDARNLVKHFTTLGYTHYVNLDNKKKKINHHTFNPILRSMHKENKIKKCSQKLWEKI